MKISFHPKVILAAIALLIALVGLGYPFVHDTYGSFSGIRTKAEVSGYGLVFPVYGLFFYGLVFILLLFRGSIKYLPFVLSILNIFFLFYLRIVLLSDEMTYPNNLYPASGFYAFTFAAFLLLFAGILALQVRVRYSLGK